MSLQVKYVLVSVVMKSLDVPLWSVIFWYRFNSTFRFLYCLYCSYIVFCTVSHNGRRPSMFPAIRQNRFD